MTRASPGVSVGQADRTTPWQKNDVDTAVASEQPRLFVFVQCTVDEVDFASRHGKDPNNLGPSIDARGARQHAFSSSRVFMRCTSVFGHLVHCRDQKCRGIFGADQVHQQKLVQVAETLCLRRSLQEVQVFRRRSKHRYDLAPNRANSSRMDTNSSSKLRSSAESVGHLCWSGFEDN